MMSAKDVRGEVYRFVGVFLLATISLTLSYFSPFGNLSELLNIRTIPCLGLGILSGVFYIFWIALAREIYGKGWGFVVSVLIVSFLLLAGPWYGVVEPQYFGVFGFLSFALMGIATDFINGGVGSIICLLVNWIAFGYFKGFFPKPILLAVLTLIVTFISGFSFDMLAKIVKKRIITY